MVRVEFLGPIGKAPMELEVASLEELASVLKQEADLAKWLDQCAVAVNDRMVADRSMALKAGDKVALLPPVCGG